jgi:hypothetical protein
MHDPADVPHDGDPAECDDVLGLVSSLISSGVTQTNRPEYVSAQPIFSSCCSRCTSGTNIFFLFVLFVLLPGV